MKNSPIHVQSHIVPLLRSRIVSFRDIPLRTKKIAANGRLRCADYESKKLLPYDCALNAQFELKSVKLESLSIIKKLLKFKKRHQ